MSLGVKLRRIRHKKNLSQAEVADKLSVSQPAYHLWETDQAKPAADNLLKLAEFFEVDIYDLFQGQNTTSNSQTLNLEKNSDGLSSDFAINKQSSELLESVLKNQEQITKLLEAQNKLIESLLKKD